ncbi:MAG: nucleoside hydrolase [Clostridia bacterium]|nr:nucleoside hydrolase [Clostridia bacterium]
MDINEIKSVGSIRYSHKKTDYVVKHRHERWEIVYYVKGKGQVSVYGDNFFNFRYCADSVILIPKTMWHDEFAAEYTEIVCNQIDMPENLPLKPIFIKMTAAQRSVFAGIKKKMLDINERYLKLEENADGEGAQELKSLVERLQINIFQLIHENKRDKNLYFHNLVSIMKEYIGRNFTKKINFDILAEDLSYSYDRLRHIFMEHTGMTLYTYQQGLKLNYAKEMLVTTNIKIFDLARRCGFKRGEGFVDWFTKRVGISPLKYRNMNRIFKWGVVLNLSDAKESSAKTNLIIDTDLGCDCDDAAALMIANILHKENYTNILCVTHSLNDPEGGRCVELINRTYGNNIEIGVSDCSKIDAEKYLTRFVYKLYEEYEPGKSFPEAMSLIKEKLALVEDDSVTIACIGQLNNLAKLLKDPEGAMLLRRKVSSIVVMAGRFDDYGESYEWKGGRFKAEFNIATDIESARMVVENTDLPLIFVDFNQGCDVLTGDVLEGLEKNPVARIYKLFGVVERESWDPIAVLYATLGGGGMFRISEAGTVSIDGDGRTKFQEGIGNHHILSAVKKKDIKQQINAILKRISEVYV